MRLALAYRFLKAAEPRLADPATRTDSLKIEPKTSVLAKRRKTSKTSRHSSAP